MSIDKSISRAPQGIASLEEGPEIEIIIEGESDDYEPDGAPDPGDDFDRNLAEDPEIEKHLGSLASTLVADYEEDCTSRKDWLDTYIKGLKLLGLKYEDRTEPWAGACGVHHPLLMESAVRFQSETIMETFPAAGPVKTHVIGKETPEKLASAKRVADDMNYELTEVMQEYRIEHERMLMALCLSGNSFKKVYFDPSLDRQTSVYIAAEDVIVPYGAANIQTAERITHRMRKTKNEMRRLQVSGFYRDIPLGEPMLVLDEVEKQKALDSGMSATMDHRFCLLEMHVDMHLPGHEDKDEDGEETGIKLPYVVTVEKGTNTVLSIRRNWLESDPLKARRQHFVHYGYIPGFGFYYFGMIHLIGGHTKAATSLMRQLIDAGTLSNLPGGMKSRGLRIKGDDTPIAPGEWRDVDLPSGAIKDNILPLPYKEPSQTLLELMDKVIEDGRRFAAVADLKISDMSSQAPVGTTLAILERTLKVMSAVQARIYYSMKQEFKLLAAIIRESASPDYPYTPEVGSAAARQSDYDSCDIIPVSDPNASTMSQRVVQFQAVIQLAASAPQIYDLPYLHRQMIETLGVKNSQRIVPMKDDMKPVDPVSENMAVMMGKPVKAFIEQDHEAHLAVHMSAIQDPKIMQVIGQNPQAQLIMGAAMAHIMEHVAWQYRREIEKQLGGSYPPPPDYENDTGYLPPAIEAQLSSLAAQAAAKLLQKDKQEAQAQQAQQMQQDPLIQMQQQELQIKQGELQLKQQVAQQKAQIEQLEMQLKQAEIQRKSQKDLMDAAAKKDSQDFQNQQLAQQGHIEGSKLGVQIASTHQQADIQRKQLATQAAADADKQRLEESKHEMEGYKVGADIAQKKAEMMHDTHKHVDDHMVDLHKQRNDQMVEMAQKHREERQKNLDLKADLHKHARDTETELHKHNTQLDADQAQMEAEHAHEKAIEKEKTVQAKAAAAQAKASKPAGGASKK